MNTKKQPPKAKPKTKKNAVSKRPVVAPDEPLLPTGIGDDLIPVSILVRYNTFVSHYLETLDCAEAAKVAGWVGKNTAAQKSFGRHLLNNPYVRTMIDQQYRAIIAKTKATTERVWEEISNIAFLDPVEAYDESGNVKPLSEIPEHVRRAITSRKRTVKTFGEDGESVEEEIKFAGKDAALNKLMQLHRMADNDKMVIVSGDDFLKAMEEGRERAASRSK